MSVFTCCKRCFIALFFIAIFVVLIHGWLTYKSYIFTHSAVSSVAVKYAAPKGRQLINIFAPNIIGNFSTGSRTLDTSILCRLCLEKLCMFYGKKCYNQ